MFFFFFSELEQLLARKNGLSLSEPKALAVAALEELHPELKRRQVEVIIKDLPPCSTDPSVLKQLFQNLLSNSLK